MYFFILFSILLISIFNFGILYYYKYHHRRVVLSKNFPGPPALPIIGNAHMFFGLKSENLLNVITHFTQLHGSKFRVWVGTELNVHIADIKDAEEILSNSKFNEKANEYKYLQPWLREGLLVSKKHKWFQRRKIITPAFHFKILEQFVEIFDKQSEIFIDKLLAAVKTNDKIDLYPFITLYALDVICETAMGVKVNAQRNSNSEYVKAIKSMSKVVFQRMTDGLYRLDFLFYFSSLAQKQKEALQIIHNFSEKVIIARREEIIKAMSDNHSLTNSTTTKRKMAFLDILLQSKIDNKPLSNLDIREEVDTFMFEGHDTVSSAIHFTLYCLARSPDVQQKCYEEIICVIGKDKEQSVTYQNLHDLHYMELCIKEALRLYPSVPMIGRKIVKECTINGIIYPKDTNIGINTFSLGRLEHIFENANEFIPERFEIETSADKLNPYAYIPFSAGPRNCIGQKFAILEIKAVVSKILRNYQLEYVGDPNGPILTFDLILRCKNNLWFKLKSRDLEN